MSFRENLRRGRSHLLLVVIMLVTAGIVVAIEDENLTRETGKAPPEHAIPLTPSDMRTVTKAPRSKPADDPMAVAQIGAYDSMADAEAAARAFAAKSGAPGTRIDRSERRGRIVYRLVVVPTEGDDAVQLCAALSRDGTDCFVRPR